MKGLSFQSSFPRDKRRSALDFFSSTVKIEFFILVFVLSVNLD